jgi:hypothetical protein
VTVIFVTGEEVAERVGKVVVTAISLGLRLDPMTDRIASRVVVSSDEFSTVNVVVVLLVLPETLDPDEPDPEVEALLNPELEDEERFEASRELAV